MPWQKWPNCRSSVYCNGVGLPHVVLPLKPSAYRVEQTDSERWKVTVRHTDEVLYQGIGPVEVLAAGSVLNSPPI